MDEKAPANFVHVVGKDIAKFHCVYWPAFLHGAGFPMPRKVLNHGHWLQNKMKMSKSLGNVVDPFQLIEDYGIHSVRSYFLSEGPL
jgi:methionyl-tRNA synthetase